MNSIETQAIANRCEVALAIALGRYVDCEVKRFTPSIIDSQRYIGLVNTKTDEQFLITIKVEKVEA